MNKLYYIGNKSNNTGWGVCNTNLYKALKKYCEVIFLSHKDLTQYSFDAPVFISLYDYALSPKFPIKCPRLMGYGFWESPLSKAAKNFVNDYHWIFAGSSWCAEKLLALTPRASPLFQGIDFARFHPQPWEKRDGFRVFSGGKFEYRKGQDIVLAVMREFMKRHDDVLLITSWENGFSDDPKIMSYSKLIDARFPFKGLPMDRVFEKTILHNKLMPNLYQQTDIGLFPNRAEGGTNLVMMEYMACERPVIASFATGHKDILKDSGPILLQKGEFDGIGWFDADIDDILNKLEEVYLDRSRLSILGKNCLKCVADFSWDRTAQEIVKIAFQS